MMKYFLTFVAKQTRKEREKSHSPQLMENPVALRNTTRFHKDSCIVLFHTRTTFANGLNGLDSRLPPRPFPLSSHSRHSSRFSLGRPGYRLYKNQVTSLLLISYRLTFFFSLKFSLCFRVRTKDIYGTSRSSGIDIQRRGKPWCLSFCDDTSLGDKPMESMSVSVTQIQDMKVCCRKRQHRKVLWAFRTGKYSVCPGWGQSTRAVHPSIHLSSRLYYTYKPFPHV